VNLAKLRRAVRRDLSDIDETEWKNKDINRAVKRAVWDLSRLIPLEKVLSTKVEYTVTDETFNSGARDVAVSLSGTPIIQAKSEKVTSKPAGTDYTRDTDYTMDYAAGTITVLSTGGMAATTDFLISYIKSKVALDISSLTDLIRVSMVEYPAGRYPEERASFSTWGDWLYIISAGKESQAALTEGEYALIFYQAYHTAPTEEADGSYPIFLDEVIAKGAGAYALLTKAFRLQHSARAAAVLAATALTNAGAVHTSVDSILAKVESAITDADGALDKAAPEVAKASTALDRVHTHGQGAKNALDAVASLISSGQTALGKVDTEITAMSAELADQEAVWTDLVKYITGASGIKGAQPFLQTGLSDYINKVTQGADPAGLVREYAETEVSIAGLWTAKAERFVAAAQARVNAALAYVGEAGQHVTSAQARIAEGTGRSAIANAYIAEASQRLNSAAAYITEAEGRLSAAGMYMQEIIRLHERVEAYLGESDRQAGLVTKYTELATLTKIEAVERRAEFWEVLTHRAQYMKKRSEVSRRQFK